eukprot:jgi/Astpho2/5058/fgenesh1_pg.00071_%23_37_t
MTAVGAFLEHIRATLSQGPKKQYYRDEPAMLHQDARAQALAEWKVLDDEGRRPFQQKAAGKPCRCCFLRLTALTIANPQALCRLLSPEDLERWEAEVAAYETGHPGYRADLEARHRGRSGAGGSLKAAVARLGLKLPRKAEDLYYKAKIEELLAHNPETKAGHSALELYMMAKRDNKERWQKMADVGRQKWQAQAHEEAEAFQVELAKHPKLLASYQDLQKAQQAKAEARAARQLRGGSHKKRAKKGGSSLAPTNAGVKKAAHKLRKSASKAAQGRTRHASKVEQKSKGEVSRDNATKGNDLYDEMPYESASETDEASEPEYDDEDEASDADGAVAGKFI